MTGTPSTETQRILELVADALSYGPTEMFLPVKKLREAARSASGGDAKWAGHTRAGKPPCPDRWHKDFPYTSLRCPTCNPPPPPDRTVAESIDAFNNRTTTGESGLLRCPFCNHHNITVHENDWATPSEYYCYCKFCHARTESHANREHAIAAWNTRSTPRAREGDGLAEIYRQGENGAIARRNELICILKEIRELLGLPSSMPLEQIPAHVASAIAGRRVGTEGSRNE